MKIFLFFTISVYAYASGNEQCPHSPLASCNEIADKAKFCESARPQICVPNIPNFPPRLPQPLPDSSSEYDCADVRFNCSRVWKEYMSCAMKVVNRHKPSYDCNDDNIICLRFPYGGGDEN